MTLSSINNADVCQTFDCKALEGTQCVRKHADNTNSTVDYTFDLQQCSTGSICPLYQAINTPGEVNTTCNSVSPVYLSYPGGHCDTKANCVQGECVGNVCTDSLPNAKCTSEINCPIGYSCRLNSSNATEPVCLPLLATGVACEKTVDCSADSACLNKVCTKYFTQEDGVDVASAAHPSQNLLCKSGFAMDTICATLKNVAPVNQTCTEDCKYTLANSTVITLANSCQCGYNTKKESYCVLGSGEQLNVDYVALRNASLADTKLCHSVERGNGYCAEKRRTDTSTTFKRASQKILNTGILSQYSPKLQNAEECVKYVAFNYDSTTIIPDKFKCAKYQCKKDVTTCASSKNPFTDAGDGIEVTLGKKCDKGLECYLGLTGTEIFYTNATTSINCQNTTGN
jgi:hypothetical protein